MSNEVTLTKDNFSTEVLESNKLVVVDFWAEWCMPCKMIAPILADLAQANPDSLVVGKVNVDHEGDLAQQYGIVSIPTILFFKDGKLVKQHVGAAPRKTLEGIIQGL
ncbi:MAG: thioredoxin [Spirochaetales bacterium]|nr:thioredoxin [Spirochaetales bacterium]